MKKNVLILLCLILVMGVISCEAKEKKEQTKDLLAPDSLINKILGDSIYKALLSNNIKCWSVKTVDTDTTLHKGVVFDDSYILDKQLAKLNSVERGVLKFVLINNLDNYEQDKMGLRSPFFPIIAFEFSKGKNKLYVLISFVDYSWNIYKSGNKIFTFNYKDKDFVERFCKFFINNY